jgi:transposase
MNANEDYYGEVARLVDALPAAPEDDFGDSWSPERLAAEEANYLATLRLMDEDERVRVAVMALWARSGLFFAPLEPSPEFAEFILALPPEGKELAWRAINGATRPAEIVAGCTVEDALVRRQEQREAGQLRGQDGRERKAKADADRAAWVVTKYHAARRRFGDGESGDVRAREKVAAAFERHYGKPITDRSVRNILRKAGIVSTRAAKTWRRKDVDLNDL